MKEFAVISGLWYEFGIWNYNVANINICCKLPTEGIMYSALNMSSWHWRVGVACICVYCERIMKHFPLLLWEKHWGRKSQVI